MICLTGKALNIWANIQLGTCHNPQAETQSITSQPQRGSSQVPSSAPHYVELHEVSSNPSSHPLRSLGFKAFGMSTSPCNLISSCTECKKWQNANHSLCPLVTKNFNAVTVLLAAFFPIRVCSHLVHSFTELKSCHQPLLGCWQHQESDPVTTRFIASLVGFQCPPQAPRASCCLCINGREYQCV